MTAMDGPILNKRVSPLDGRRFSEVIDDLDLRDLPLRGARLPGVVG